MTISRLVLLLLLLSLCATAPAEVYRWKDADGNVIFSDTPHDGAEIIELGPTTVVPGEPPATDTNAAPETADAVAQPTSYASIAVIAPADDETLRDQQSVAVDVVTEPGLMTTFGHRVQLYVNGVPFGAATDSPHFVLSDLARGSHQLAAAVLDAQGNELIRSTATVFHLRKNTVADLKTGKSQRPSLPVPPKPK
jgi:hypothetical protein